MRLTAEFIASLTLCYVLTATVIQTCSADGKGFAPICLPGWTFWGRDCYRYFNNLRLDWIAAEKYCNQFGTVHEGAEDQLAHLVSIHSEHENTFVRALWESLREPSDDRQWCWIGYNDLATEGEFVWSDQSPPQFSKWGTGQPNSHGGDQDCGAIDTSGHGPNLGSWDDGTCSSRLPFMCKMLPVHLSQ